jgi:predicted transcriptional regulator
MVFGIFGKSDKKIKELIDNKQYDELSTEVIDEIAADIILTTETSMQGYRVVDRIETITAECVFGR